MENVVSMAKEGDGGGGGVLGGGDGMGGVLGGRGESGGVGVFDDAVKVMVGTFEGAMRAGVMLETRIF